MLLELSVAVEFLELGFDHITSHRQKKMARQVYYPGGSWVLLACFESYLQPLRFGNNLSYYLPLKDVASRGINLV